MKKICKKWRFTKDISIYIIKKDCVFFDKDAMNENYDEIKRRVTVKKSHMKLDFCKSDFFAIGIVAVIAILVSVIFWTSVGSDEGSIVSVYQEGALIQELSLDSDTEFVIEGEYENVVTIQDGKAAITNSNCPGTDCVHSGWIHEAGRSIVCLPNRVELRIEGASEVDFVVR